MQTFLMSHPPERWRIRGGENFRSRVAKGERTRTNPRAAMKEWLALCDAIEQHGGQVVVLPPADADPPLTGMMYTANAGALFGSKHWLVSRMSVAHRTEERGYIRAFVPQLGFSVEEAPYTWEGQADVTTLPGARFLLTWGVRSVRESAAEVKKRLPEGARTLEVKLRDPWFHGDTCLNPLTSRAGKTVLLAHGASMVDHTLDDLREFCGGEAEVLPVSEADALGYACNALCVAGTVLVPQGLSESLLGDLRARDFALDEVALGELFGKGGGGPRCLVNELRGVGDLSSSPARYASQREALRKLAETYPTSVEEVA
jgi:N-dimethylarginine dimethylaminohydrolase